jgi:hypothetical protein
MKAQPSRAETMWLKGQNFEKPRKDKRGRIWHFRIWHDWIDGTRIQRIFFWDTAKAETGMVEFAGDAVLNVTRLKQQLSRLVADADYRQPFQSPLKIPVERHY